MGTTENLSVYDHTTKTTSLVDLDEWLASNDGMFDEDEERAIMAGDSVVIGFGDSLRTVERVQHAVPVRRAS